MKKTWSTQKAAKRMGVSFRTLNRWLFRGLIRPSIEFPIGGGRTLWRWTDADIAKRPEGEGQTEAWTEVATEEEGTMKPRVAIYARVWTTNHGQDVTVQTRELHQFAEARGWQITGEYIDAGMSGAKDSRPELNRLMADAHKRRFDVVAVWRFDRFARSVTHLLRALETFNALGISFVSLSEQMDTTTPTGKMVFTVLGAVAELERSLIVERVRAGLRNARTKGKTLGRPRKIVDAGKIAALRAQGLSLRSIASELGIGLATLHRASVPRSKTRVRDFGAG